MKDKELVDIANRHDIRFLFNRFEANNIEKAFMTAHELNQRVKPVCLGLFEKDGIKYKRISRTVWRVGKNYDKQIVIDIDGHDIANLLFVKDFYSTALQKQFHVIKTLHGYHLISISEVNRTK